jgi:hypothetical protein
LACRSSARRHATQRPTRESELAEIAAVGRSPWQFLPATDAHLNGFGVNHGLRRGSGGFSDRKRAPFGLSDLFFERVARGGEQKPS